jgi:hypothetical protein
VHPFVHKHVNAFCLFLGDAASWLLANFARSWRFYLNKPPFATRKYYEKIQALVKKAIRTARAQICGNSFLEILTVNQ